MTTPYARLGDIEKQPFRTFVSLDQNETRCARPLDWGEMKRGKKPKTGALTCLGRKPIAVKVTQKYRLDHFLSAADLGHVRGACEGEGEGKSAREHGDLCDDRRVNENKTEMIKQYNTRVDLPRFGQRVAGGLLPAVTHRPDAAELALHVRPDVATDVPPHVVGSNRFRGVADGQALRRPFSWRRRRSQPVDRWRWTLRKTNARTDGNAQQTHTHGRDRLTTLLLTVTAVCGALKPRRRRHNRQRHASYRGASRVAYGRAAAATTTTTTTTVVHKYSLSNLLVLGETTWW